ncbi:MAG: hypothetical protein HUU37_04615 [Bdellovibrionales bacterium]|nr:hypothetical protein [Bdellovibrionales bacterium]
MEARIRSTLGDQSVFRGGRAEPSFTAGYEKLFAAIKTPADLLAAWRMLARLAKAEYRIQGEWSAYEKDFASLLLRDLTKTDSIKPQSKMAARFNAGEKAELFRILHSIHDGVSNKPLQKGWGDYISTIEILFDPGSVEKFLSRVDGSGYYAQSLADGTPSAAAHRGTITALQGLPDPVRREARERTLAEFRASRLQDDSDLPKAARRNWEFLHRVLSEKEFQEFFRGLGKRTRIGGLAPKVDAYWKKAEIAPEYSFSDVYKAAKSLQASLRKHLDDDGLLLYGSFPNGKGVTGASDVDVHPGAGLMKKYIEAFTKYGNYPEPDYQSASRQVPKFAGALSRDLISAEKRLARTLGVKGHKPGQLMTIVAVEPPREPWEKDFFRPEMIAQYNPILVRVTKDRVFLEVYDALGTGKLSRVEILD